MKATISEIISFVTQRIEDETERERVLAWAEANQGKAVRSNNLPKGFIVNRQYGMTHLETPDYSPSHGHNGSSYHIAYTEKGATVPTPDKLKELSAAYFRGADERNAYRREFLADPKRFQATAAAVVRTRRAVAEYRAALVELEQVTEYPCPERYALADLAGVIQEKRAT